MKDQHVKQFLQKQMLIHKYVAAKGWRRQEMLVAMAPAIYMCLPPEKHTRVQLVVANTHQKY